MIFTFPMREWFFAVLGLVNLALTATLVYGIAMQSELLPGTFGGCKGLSTSWRQALPVEMRSAKTASDASLYSACKTMVEHWAYAIAIAILYLFYSLTLIYYGAHGIVNPRPPEYSRPFHPLTGIKIQGRIYFAIRYMSKFFQRFKSESMKPPKHAVTRHSDRKDCRSSVFTRGHHDEKPQVKNRHVLPANVLLNIASYVHYVDILNLRTAQPSLFREYIGSEDEETKLDELRIPAGHLSTSPVQQYWNTQNHASHSAQRASAIITI
ncbi:hypothetical protein BBP40_000744 [Aspergillus hancockii]|nr:hypothetical protein BBP40_000744 [Aspergillus hancockii]